MRKKNKANRKREPKVSHKSNERQKSFGCHWPPSTTRVQSLESTVDFLEVGTPEYLSMEEWNNGNIFNLNMFEHS